DVRDVPRNVDRGYLLEPLLPVPIESVHAVYVTLGDDRMLACAAPKEALEGVGPDALLLSPESLPDAVATSDVDPSRLNLLVGPYQPRPLRRLRAVWHVIIAACASLVTFGLHTRARVYERAAADADQLLTALYDQALPRGQRAGSTQDPGLL